MPCLVLSFQYIPKAAYYFFKEQGSFLPDEPKTYKEFLAGVTIYKSAAQKPCLQQPRTEGSRAMNFFMCTNSLLNVYIADRTAITLKTSSQTSKLV